METGERVWFQKLMSRTMTVSLQHRIAHLTNGCKNFKAWQATSLPHSKPLHPGPTTLWSFSSSFKSWNISAWFQVLSLRMERGTSNLYWWDGLRWWPCWETFASIPAIRHSKMDIPPFIYFRGMLLSLIPKYQWNVGKIAGLFLLDWKFFPDVVFSFQVLFQRWMKFNPGFIPAVPEFWLPTQFAC